jgi:hypothetical protein
MSLSPHDVRRTVATQVARGTTLANGTALLGHADESTTSRHYVQQIHVAPDLRVVIDEFVSHTSEETLLEGKGESKGSGGSEEGPHSRIFMRVGPDWR